METKSAPSVNIAEPLVIPLGNNDWTWDEPLTVPAGAPAAAIPPVKCAEPVSNENCITGIV